MILGLCVAKMVLIAGPASDAGNMDYKIDATEVTRGQYDAWLATNPALPSSTNASCNYVTTYAEQRTEGVYTGPDADQHPVVYVDWCDAYAYCSGVGKRLCGAIGGGSNEFGSYKDASKSQWYRACSSGGIYSYPYGNTYQPGYCDGWDYWNDNSLTMQTVPVGSLVACATSAAGYAGVYDLSGNVWEWEDSCTGTDQLDPCPVRGGAFNDSGSGNLTCGYGTYDFYRHDLSLYIGFRCCSP